MIMVRGFLASQDALEVMLVSELLTLRTKLTDVTLVSEDTDWGLYWCNFGDWWYHNKEMKIGAIDM